MSFNKVECEVSNTIQIRNNEKYDKIIESLQYSASQDKSDQEKNNHKKQSNHLENIDICEIIQTDKRASRTNSILACKCVACGTVFTIKIDKPENYDHIKYTCPCPDCGCNECWGYISLARYKLIRYYRKCKRAFRKAMNL